MPTYHLASCVDDADLRISHIIRGQDHLTNTFKHLLIFEGLGAEPPQFAHLPLLVAPDGTKLSKRKHGPVVSVTTYRDAGFLPEAFINFLCLLGWSPKDDREFLTLEELDRRLHPRKRQPLQRRRQLHGRRPLRCRRQSGSTASTSAPSPSTTQRRASSPSSSRPACIASPEKLLAVTPLIRERIKLLKDAVSAADFFFVSSSRPTIPPS